MNAKQLQKLGVPPDCTKAAIQALSRAAEQGTGNGAQRASGRGSLWRRGWRIRGPMKRTRFGVSLPAS